MDSLMSSPIFGVMLSAIAFEIGNILYNKTKVSLFNPLLISQVLIIAILSKFKISFNDYNMGGQIISFFLIPSTVILAVPLYKKIKLLKAYSIPIIGGIAAGSISGIVSIILLSKLFHLDKVLLSSLVPKSVTTPIGMEISKQIGGIPAVTVASIVATGIIGSVIAPYICKMFKITDEIAVGIAIGTSSHAIGTAKALEIGEVEGAMSGLAIGVAGLVTVFAAPLIIRLCQALSIL
ncbi:LrgB family protein [Fonticella tunisiensis]|uniref:Putative murein hydrolase (TIGR00659 family) n=1 Tax=Fonticella tunisiensis TaxID=1096341 RepID=A0A4R7KWK3_9CLOT|nr:LrgB family protein [Fonticella tunisiensis]TDT63350.1 putative murein hydrolase (TIGR00659 family) [Fonticella tunisiensis]